MLLELVLAEPRRRKPLLERGGNRLRGTQALQRRRFGIVVEARRAIAIGGGGGGVDKGQAARRREGPRRLDSMMLVSTSSAMSRSVVLEIAPMWITAATASPRRPRKSARSSGVTKAARARLSRLRALSPSAGRSQTATALPFSSTPSRGTSSACVSSAISAATDQPEPPLYVHEISVDCGTGSPMSWCSQTMSSPPPTALRSGEAPGNTLLTMIDSSTDLGTRESAPRINGATSNRA